MGKLESIEYGKYIRPFLGERHCGDLVILHKEGNLGFFVLIDCLGHGKSAYLMGIEIRNAIEKCWAVNPSEVIACLGSNIKPNVGAAIAVLVINIEDYSYKYAGLGNITCKIVGKKNLDLRSSDGVLGMRNRSTVAYEGLLKSGDFIMLSSDGLSNASAIESWNKYKILSCSFAAKRLVQRLGTDLDDSSCLVIKYNTNNGSL